MKAPLRITAASFSLVVLLMCSPCWAQVFETQSPPADSPVSPVEAHQRAIEQIVTSTKSDQVRARVNAIEAARLLPDRVTPMVQLALTDKHEAVRFAALVTAGELKLTAIKSAVKPYLSDDSESVRAAAIFALYRCGESIDLSPMAEILVSQNPTSRSNAAMLLGLMGDRSAAPMLIDLAHVPLRMQNAEHDLIFRLQVAEAVVRLLEGVGDEVEIEHFETALGALRAAAWSGKSYETRVFAVLMLGRIRDARMEAGIRQFLKEPPIELQLAAAEYTARIRRPVGEQLVYNATQSPIAPVRAQAAMILGLYGQRRAADRLAELLDDSDELVRLAASAALLGGQSQAPAN